MADTVIAALEAAAREHPGRIAYAILDARLYEIAGYQRAIRSEVPPYRAGSIAELAALIDVPAAALQETVARYNAATTGDTDRFDATCTDGLAAAANLTPPKSNWARPLDRPPHPRSGAGHQRTGGRRHRHPGRHHQGPAGGAQSRRHLQPHRRPAGTPPGLPARLRR